MELTVDRISEYFARRSDTADRVVAVCEDRQHTWAEIDRGAAVTAARLSRAGVGDGDRIALMLPNTEAFLAAVFGAAKVGAVVVPINTRLTPAEVGRSLTAVGGVRLLACTADYQSLADSTGIPTLVLDRDLPGGETSSFIGRVEPIEPDRAFWIAFTSGTTGAAKPAVVTHRRLVDSWIAMRTELEVDRHDTMMLTLPTHGSSGFSLGLMTLYAGGRLNFQPHWDPSAAARTIDTGAVTLLPLTPSMFSEMLAVPRQPDDQRPRARGISVGGGLPPNTREELDRRFPTMDVLDFYGSTEMGPTTISRPTDSTNRTGSVGRPILGVRLSIRDDSGNEVLPGELGRVYKRGVPLGWEYLGDDASTQSIRLGDWVTSDDLGLLDGEGFLHLRGRLHDRIATGGFKVYPQEIENLLIQHPAIEQVAVVGLPDSKWGEKIAAFIVERGDASLTVGDLRQHFAGQLADFKFPKSLYSVDALPTSANGKVLRRKLQELASMSNSTE